MSRHDGTSAGAKSAEEARRPYVVETFDARSFVYRPLKGGRFAAYDAALEKARNLAMDGVKCHIVEFVGSKPQVVWQS